MSSCKPVDGDTPKERAGAAARRKEAGEVNQITCEKFGNIIRDLQLTVSTLSREKWDLHKKNETLRKELSMVGQTPRTLSNLIESKDRMIDKLKAQKYAVCEKNRELQKELDNYKTNSFIKGSTNNQEKNSKSRKRKAENILPSADPGPNSEPAHKVSPQELNNSKKIPLPLKAPAPSCVDIPKEIEKHFVLKMALENCRLPYFRTATDIIDSLLDDIVKFKLEQSGSKVMLRYRNGNCREQALIKVGYNDTYSKWKKNKEWIDAAIKVNGGKTVSDSTIFDSVCRICKYMIQKYNDAFWAAITDQKDAPPMKPMTAVQFAALLKVGRVTTRKEQNSVARHIRDHFGKDVLPSLFGDVFPLLENGDSSEVDAFIAAVTEKTSRKSYKPRVGKDDEDN